MTKHAKEHKDPSTKTRFNVKAAVCLALFICTLTQEPERMFKPNHATEPETMQVDGTISEHDSLCLLAVQIYQITYLAK